MGNIPPCDPNTETCGGFDTLGAIVQLNNGKKPQLVKIQKPIDFSKKIQKHKTRIKRCKGNPRKKKFLKKKLKKIQSKHMVYIVTPVKKLNR